MIQTQSLGPYVFENIVDGVLLLTSGGTIVYMNKSAKSMLSIKDAFINTPFLKNWILDIDARNDEICQVILDAVYNKHLLISKKVTFYNENGEKQIFHIKSSYWSSDDEDTENGVLLIMQNITTEETLKKEKDDAIFIFSIFLVCVGIWNLFYGALKFFEISIPHFKMTYILLAVGFILAWFIYKRTNFTYADMGLTFKNIRKQLICNICISVIACLIMVAAKAILLRNGSGFFPKDQPFWDFNFTIGMKLYPISVFLQEFLSQGIIHGCLMRILKGKNSKTLAVLLSAVLFTTLHIHRGFGFMVGSLILICIIGILYRKQRTIWGICITHYTTSMVAFFLNWL